MYIDIKKAGAETPIPYHLLLMADPYRLAIDRYLNQSDVYIAECESRVAGVYVLLPLNDLDIELKNIAVEESLQGRGIGKQLLAHAVKNAVDAGYKTVWVGTGNSSLSELAFYQKQGFEIEAIKKNFFSDHYPEPIFENGIPCKHMIMLVKRL